MFFSYKRNIEMLKLFHKSVNAYIRKKKKHETKKNASESTVAGGNNGGTNLSVITNGAFATARNNSTTVTIGQKIAEDKWVQVDLGKAYDTSKIDRIVVQYYSLNTSARAGYKILSSLNGIDFVEVGSAEPYTSATGNPIVCLDKITLTEEQAEAIPYAKYVRVVATSDNNTNNGLQVMGMAVLTDGITKVNEVEFQEVETLDDPVSLTVTSSDYEQLEYVFEASEGDEGDYTYYAYIGGKQKQEPGTAKITVTGIGLYEGTLEGTFEIAQKEITETNIDFTQVKESYVYAGVPIEPVVAIEGLEKDIDYTVVVSDNLVPGTAKIVITGIGNYTGEISKEFTITKKDVNSVQVEVSYKGKELVVNVKDAHHQMVKDVDYKYTVVQDAKGNVTVTVEGIGGCFEGKVVKTIAAKDNPNAQTTVAPTKNSLARTTVQTVSKKKAEKKVKITFKKIKGAKKYQIQISTTKKFKKVLVKKTVKKVKVTITSKKLKNKKKLYVRVRAVGAKKWSKVKKVKITK